jgi:hypothetical protein
MKTRSYIQLTKDEKNRALGTARCVLMDSLYEGTIEIEMPNKKLKSDFEVILKSSRMGNSLERFTKLIAEHFIIQKELNKLCVIVVEGSQYTENGYAIGIRS